MMRTNVGSTLSFRDVRHVPTLWFNLISKLELGEEGYETQLLWRRQLETCSKSLVVDLHIDDMLMFDTDEKVVNEIKYLIFIFFT